jgi:hypothetical protein
MVLKQARHGKSWLHKSIAQQFCHLFEAEGCTHIEASKVETRIQELLQPYIPDHRSDREIVSEIFGKTFPN